MELYRKVRQAYLRQGLSKRRIARGFGISRESVDRMVAYSAPPGYRRTAPIRRPKLDGFSGLETGSWKRMAGDYQRQIGPADGLDHPNNVLAWLGMGTPRRFGQPSVLPPGG